MAALRIRVRGMVQGVGFRWFARERARRGDLAGWVRNCPDGSVEIEAAGDASHLERFVDAIRSGPPGARVDDVECLPLDEPRTLERPFGIRR